MRGRRATADTQHPLHDQLACRCFDRYAGVRKFQGRAGALLRWLRWERSRKTIAMPSVAGTSAAAELTHCFILIRIILYGPVVN
jgi:hypothetical protein